MFSTHLHWRFSPQASYCLLAGTSGWLQNSLCWWSEYQIGVFELNPLQTSRWAQTWQQPHRSSVNPTRHSLSEVCKAMDRKGKNIKTSQGQLPPDIWTNRMVHTASFEQSRLNRARLGQLRLEDGEWPSLMRIVNRKMCYLSSLRRFGLLFCSIVVMRDRENDKEADMLTSFHSLSKEGGKEGRNNCTEKEGKRWLSV